MVKGFAFQTNFPGDSKSQLKFENQGASHQQCTRRQNVEVGGYQESFLCAPENGFRWQIGLL